MQTSSQISGSRFNPKCNFALHQCKGGPYHPMR